MAEAPKPDEKGSAGAILFLLILLIVVVLALAKMGYLDLGELIRDIKALF